MLYDYFFRLGLLYPGIVQPGYLSTADVFRWSGDKINWMKSMDPHNWIEERLKVQKKVFQKVYKESSMKTLAEFVLGYYWHEQLVDVLSPKYTGRMKPSAEAEWYLKEK